MLTGNEVALQEAKPTDHKDVFGEDEVRRAFSPTRNTPAAIRVLQRGVIDSTVAYELACGRVPYTREDFYTVNMTSLRAGTSPKDLVLGGGRLNNWIMSGVFWTLREARAYIGRLKSEAANL